MKSHFSVAAIRRILLNNDAKLSDTSLLPSDPIGRAASKLMELSVFGCYRLVVDWGPCRAFQLGKMYGQYDVPV